MNTFRTDHSPGSVTPMDIADNPFLGVREKLDLLRQLKAQADAGDDAAGRLGFRAEDVDDAIAEVRRRVQDGTAHDHHLQGARNG